MRVLLDLFLLWKAVPILLNHFNLVKTWHETDENGNRWTSPGVAPGSARDQPSPAVVLVSALGAFYAIKNLFSR